MLKKMLMGAIAVGLMCISAQNLYAGCEVEWKGSWYKATVLKSNDSKTQHYIHYDGWSDSWNEWVGTGRMRGCTAADAAVEGAKQGADAIKGMLGQ